MVLDHILRGRIACCEYVHFMILIAIIVCDECDARIELSPRGASMVRQGSDDYNTDHRQIHRNQKQRRAPVHVLQDATLVLLAVGPVGVIHSAAHHVGIAIGLVALWQLAQLTAGRASAALIDIWTIASQAARIAVGTDAIVKWDITTSTFRCLQWIDLVDETVASKLRHVGTLVQWRARCVSAGNLNVCHAYIYIVRDRYGICVQWTLVVA